MTLKYGTLFLIALLSIFLNSCQENGHTDQQAKRKFLDPANMDTTIHPGDDFFRFANGNWLDNNSIPKAETSWGSFDELNENTRKQLHNLLESAASDQDAAPGSAVQKVRDLYQSGMDSTTIEAAGITPLQETLDRIDAIEDIAGLTAQIAALHTKGNSQLFSFAVYPDDKNVSKQMPQFYQGGLGMPDRDYYFNKDKRTTTIRNAYREYIETILLLAGTEKATAKKEAAGIYNLEAKLAEASMTRLERRDPYKTYNKFSTDELKREIPDIYWRLLFSGLGIGQEDSCIVAMPDFFREVGVQLTATPLATWKKYLQFHTISDMSPYLSQDFVTAHFNFYGKTIRGQEEQKPRWHRVLGVVNNAIGELLGQMYVDKYFKPEAKQRMLTLVNNLQDTYSDRIKRLDWMSETTKQKALAKLNTFLKKIGYPDRWRDYGKLEIAGNDYIKNISEAAAFEYNHMINKLGKPVDKTEWMMTPPTVNAYYNPSYNEIVFPAGILQYPFFDFDADDAVNYGGIGAVIGHEMTHGFDDQGRQYDAEGNLNDWWTENDAARFNERVNKVVEQFNQYKVLDSVAVNGKLTLGENLADLGGLAIAYEAFMKTPQAKKGEKIDGFTPQQRFYLSWAQVWRTNTRPEEMVSRIMTDPHSPEEWRCNGPLSNINEFYEAFNVQEGHKMYRPESDRIQIW